ncbi:NAD(P)H-binding protein [Paenibacillus assamensis]|uniref:NAD(P)H-binding protein n=1 Tax=Paenibacillus assamensis TaxID=311244 RepID=UPI000404423B|nr:NAD(P)H-binding protein [Paenibacillus assamensis]
MTILVTGATGTVGRHIVSQLVEKGERVRALSRNPEKANMPAGVEVVAGDLNAPETLQAALEGVTGLHVITSSLSADGYLQTNAELIDMAEKAGVRRVTVLVGYEGAVEEAVQRSSMEWTFLKPVEVMANALIDWTDSIRTEGVVREPFGNVPSSRVHEADIASVAVAALLDGGHHKQSYFITGPEVLTRIEAVQVISEAIGKEIHFIELTEEQARDRWREQGYEEGDIDFFVEMGKNPPEVGYTVLPTVEDVVGRRGRTFAEWAVEHKDYFV